MHDRGGGGAPEEAADTLECSADTLEEGNAADTAAATAVEKGSYMVEEPAGALEKRIVALEKQARTAH